MSFLPGKQPIVQSTPYNPVETRTTWTTGFFSRFPWGGISALIGAVLCAAASTAILLASDGKVNDWRLQPTVYLAITSALSSILVHYALSVGVSNSWWRKAMKEGTTVNDLHRYWEYGNSLWSATLAGKHFNLVALATIMASITPVSGPLIQRASSVVAQELNRNISMTVNMSPELPFGFTGIISGRGRSVAVLTSNFSSVMRDYNNKASTNMSNTGCKGTCSAVIQGAGLAMNCSQRTIPFDLRPGSGPPFNFNQTKVFSSNFTYSESIPDSIQLNVQYKATPDCVGDLVVSTCLLRAAVVKYPVVFRNDSVTLNPNSSITDDKLERYTKVGTTASIGGTTLGGLYLALDNRFSSAAGTSFSGAVGYTLQTNGSLATEYVATADDKAAYNAATNCTITFFDPTADLVAAAREIMFRTAIRAANSSTIQKVQATEVAVRTIYRSHYLFLGLSILVTMLGVVFVAPIFGGWWHLGRSMSMSPIETAKAFSAPLLKGHDSNAGMKGILKEVGTKDLRYGEVVRVNGGGVRGDVYIPPDTPNTTRTLEMANPAWVRAPQEGSRYSG
ncbi:MAG: hypothetical protein M1835_002533 [Candelina submexicana]|nr:MAG: hypothetical protein M1835_002533 [Candelina submexicana]